MAGSRVNDRRKNSPSIDHRGTDERINVTLSTDRRISRLVELGGKERIR